MSKAAAPAFVQEEAGIQEYRLSNGLKLLLVHNPAAPVVTVQVVYHVGSRNEAVGHTGATHFLEHMLFKGTPSFNKAKGSQIPQVLNRIGANFNATTWLDRTTYYETVPADQLELALQLEAERMQHAFIRDRDRQMEMTVVRNEMERDENDPDSQMFKHLFAQAYLAHPYHHPTIGWHSDVEGMPTARLRQFYKDFYHPNNATLLLVGDFERKSALELVTRHFGPIPASAKPIPVMYTHEQVQQGERRFVLRRPGQLGSVQMAWHVPPMQHADSHALDVLQDILSEGVNSRLYQAVVETQLGLYAGAYNLQLRDPGLFIAFAKLSSGVSHAEVETAILACISDLQQQPPAERELQRVKNQVRAAFSYQRHGAHQLASMLAEFEAAASWQYMVHYLERLDAVTAADVQRVAQTYLKPDNRTVGHFVPEASDSIALTQTEATAPVPRPAAKAAAGQQRRAGKSKIQRQTFGNGVLLTQENHLDNTVALHGQLRAGVAYNPDSVSPLAQLAVGMLKKGTQNYDKLVLADQLAQLGTSIDFRLGADTVSFSVRCLSEHFERSLALLHEILLQPRFEADEFDKLRRQRIDRLKQRRDNTDAMAYDLLYRQLYPAGHYHHQPEIEALIAATEAATLDDVMAFYHQHYRSGGMVLAGVGDFDSQSLYDFAQNRFADWQPEILPWPVIPDQPLQAAGQTLVCPMPDKANVSIVMGHQSQLKRTDPDYFAAMLGNHVLGQSSLSSRLGLRIRDQLGLTYGIYSHFPDLSRSAGPWVVAVTTHPDNVQAVLAETRKVIRQVLSKGLTPTELSEARSSLTGSYLVNLTTHPEIAARLLQLEHYQLGLNYFQRRGKLIAAVSDEAVQQALRQHLHPDRLSVAIAGKYE
ncbi:MAG: insulinase family protein [Candidatus Sericytochromatia bacterium]|nr:insulinase family protein [Candidatus Sericytochromatia bacterium]